MLGIHLSYVPGGIAPALEGAAPLSGAERRMLKARATWDQREGAYEHLHCTKPQTIAYALTDSPVGLAAWIIEKWHGWTDCGGDVESVIGRDELLANVSWYWLTRSAATSVRLTTRPSTTAGLGPGDRVRVPTAIASFPKELVVAPREWAERIYDVVQWTDMPRGGHFAAAEQPELLAEDVRRFFFETLA